MVDMGVSIHTSDAETSAPTAPLGLFSCSPSPTISANIPMAAILVEMDEEEEGAIEVDGAIACL